MLARGTSGEERGGEAGSSVRPWVKTSLAPGSRVVTKYLEAAGLMPFLEALRFHSGGLRLRHLHRKLAGRCPSRWPMPCEENDLVVAGVLSGNRNFEGRINPTSRRTTWPARRWSWPTRWRERWTSTSPASPWPSTPTASPSTWQISGPATPMKFAPSRRHGHGEDVRGRIRRRLPGRRALAGGAHGRRRSVRLGRGSTYIRNPPFFTELAREAAQPRAHPGRAGAGARRAIGHHRSHLSGRLHQEGRPRRPVPR